MMSSANETMIDDIKKYEIVGGLGEGTFGTVSKARNRENGEWVAIKVPKIINESNSSEAAILRSIQHDNIVKLLGIVRNSEGNITGMVFELMDFSVSNIIIQARRKLNEEHIKLILHQVLSAVKYLHENKIIHRDLKAKNVMVNKAGRCKIIDFGISRYFEPSNPLVKYLGPFGALRYRSPELLLHSEFYSTSSDLWAVGCLFAWLTRGKYLFRGENEDAVLQSIFDIFGVPTEDTWPGVSGLPGMAAIRIRPNSTKQSLSHKFQSYLSTESLNLLEKLLQLNPLSRISAAEAYNHECFADITNAKNKYKSFAKWLSENISPA